MSTNGRPTAPVRAESEHREPVLDLPVPDHKDPEDGINDDENTNLETFLENAFDGKYEGPREGDRAWPAIDAKYFQFQRDYFRRPDIELGEGGLGRLTHAHDSAQGQPEEEHKQQPLAPYGDLLLEVMEKRGLYKKRGALTHAGRAVAGTLIGATLVGGIYLAKVTNQVRPGEVAFWYTINDHPRFTPSGWSFEPNPAHKSFQKFQLHNDINFDNHVHVIKVKPGEVMVGSSNGSPVVLSAGANNTVGVHVLVDPNFVREGTQRVDSPHMQAGALHVFVVMPRSVRAVLIDRCPHVLFEGRHVLECPSLEPFQGDLAEDVSMDRSFSVGGLLHHAVVEPGMVGGFRVGNHACFVDRPVRMWFYSEIAEVMRPKKIETERIEFHHLTRVIVSDYRMGTIQDRHGTLRVLRPGIHTIRAPVLLCAVTSTEWNHVREPMEAITADPLDVRLTMTMAWHVVDPIAHYKAGSPDETAKTITQMALSTMSRVVRNMRFEETLRVYAEKDDGREAHKLVADAKKDGKKGPGEAEGEDIVPDQMMQSQFHEISTTYEQALTSVFRRDFGVEMDQSVWGFQDFDLKDQSFQEKLTGAVVARADARAARVKLDLTQDTAEIRKQTARIEAEQRKYTQTLEAETDREVKLLQMKTEQEVQDSLVNAVHLRKQKEREIELEDARAKADAAAYKMRAEAEARLHAAKLEAEAARYKAEQEAEAIKLRAQAEKLMLECNPERFRIEMAQVQSEAVRGMNPSVTVNSGADVVSAVSSLMKAYTSHQQVPAVQQQQQQHHQ